MIEGLIILAGILMTRFVLRPPKGLRLVAWANFAIFVIFSIGFSQMTGSSAAGVDALKFYKLGTLKVVGELENFSQANFVFFLSNKIQSLVPMSYMAFNLFAAVFFSYTALLLILRPLENPSQRLVMFWWLLTILPGFHFWHASFGKESIQLLFIATYFSFTHLAIRGGSVVLLSMVRPHIALAIGMAEVVTNLFSKTVSLQRLVILVGGSLVAVSVLTYLVSRVSGGDDGLGIADVWALFQDYGSDWREGDLRLNHTASPLAPVEFLLRPYFWEINGPAVFVSSFDSLLMSVVGVYILISVPVADKFKAPWLFAIFVTFLMAVTNPNVGTSHRKKQIFPVVAVIVISAAFLRRRNKKNTRQNGYYVVANAAEPEPQKNA